MPLMEVEALTATEINYNDLVMNAKLLTLDEIYDAGILYFEYSNEIDGFGNLVTPSESPANGHAGIFAVGGEHSGQFTANIGTWLNLSHINIHDVEVSETGSETVYTEDEQYELDKNNGKIKALGDQQAEVTIVSNSESDASFKVTATEGGDYDGTAGNDVTVEIVDSAGAGGLAVTFDGADDIITIDFDGDATATALAIANEVDALTHFNGAEEVSGDFTSADDVGVVEGLAGGIDGLIDNTEYDISYTYGAHGCFVDGLLQGETYYYRAYVISVAYDSAEMMDRAVDDEGFMDDLVNNSDGMDKVTDSEIAMDKIIDSETAMDKIIDSEIAMNSIIDSEIAMDKIIDSETFMNSITDSETLMNSITDSEIAMDSVMDNVDGRTKMLSSPHILDTMWSKEMASEKFWKVGSPEPPRTFNASNGEEYIVSINKTGDNELKVETQGGETNYVQVNIWSIDINFDEIQTLKLKTFASTNSNDFEMYIKINGIKELTLGSSNHSWTERSIDCSTINGTQTVTWETDSHGNPRDDVAIKDLHLE